MMTKHLLFIMALLFNSVFLVSAHALENLHFAAPYTGQKVSQYEITLPIARKKEAPFSVPENCTKLIDLYQHGAFQWGNRIERSLWSKVNNDCRYYHFLSHFPAIATQDFVSNYDFYNADFNDLPIKPNCDSLIDGPNCIPMPDGIRSLSTFIPFLNSASNNNQNLSDECRFENGLFRGRILLTPSGLRCQPDIKAPGCRILSVDLADVNGDNYQDVILKLIPLGRSKTRSPFILPLTRTSEDAKFHIPAGVVMPDIRH